MLKPTYISLALVFCLSTAPAYADWDSFFKDITEAGKEFLSDDETTSVAGLDTSTVIAGLKEALDIGARYAIDNASQTDGYFANDLIRIPMPDQLQQASDLMRNFGLNELADEFELSLNRAAEAAAPQATNIIVDAIKNMTIEDATNILNGPDDAATQYFKQQTSEQLANLFKPNIENSLNQVGSTKYYNDLTNQIAAIPIVGESINLDLPDYVTTKALDGLFSMIALEEQKIRENPAARTTELLQQVFSSK